MVLFGDPDLMIVNAALDEMVLTTPDPSAHAGQRHVVYRTAPRM